jgi:hypothetical protein
MACSPLSTYNITSAGKRKRSQHVFHLVMADNQLLLGNDDDDAGGEDDVFVYTGGDQEVPDDVRRLRIAENVDTIPERTFHNCDQLIEVRGHNKIRTIKKYAFDRKCYRLRRVTKMQGVEEIEENAFGGCNALSYIDFDKLEIIGERAFCSCFSLKSINMPFARRVGEYAFAHCAALTDVVFGKNLERIETRSFICRALRRIVIPLKDDLIIHSYAFNGCENFSRVDVIAGEIHNTISSLQMESWRNEMDEEIDRINQTLPNTQSYEKAEAIQEWVTRVLDRMEHYKTEHKVLVKEAMTLLELTLWKAKLLNETDEKKCSVDEVTKKAKIDAEAARKEHRVTCGASIVIKNVLPFLALQ